jgi:hypothetical protein
MTKKLASTIARLLGALADLAAQASLRPVPVPVRK